MLDTTIIRSNRLTLCLLSGAHIKMFDNFVQNCGAPLFSALYQMLILESHGTFQSLWFRSFLSLNHTFTLDF